MPIPGPLPAAGAATVGLLAEQPPLARLAVRMLRVHGTMTATAFHGELDEALGCERAADVMALFTTFARICEDYGRRPLACHGRDCPCLGADEACLAQLVASASAGEHEDAMLLAALIVRAESASALATVAAELGAWLDLAARRPARRLI